MEHRIDKNCVLPVGSGIEEIQPNALSEDIIKIFKDNECDVSKFWITPVDVYSYHTPTATYIRILLP